MKFSPVRRSQLVAPFGVGAMFTAPDGTGMITGGLDGWFDQDEYPTLDIEEFRVSEWRLEEELKVRELRLPPTIVVSGGARIRIRIWACLSPLCSFLSGIFVPRRLAELCLSANLIMLVESGADCASQEM